MSHTSDNPTIPQTSGNSGNGSLISYTVGFVLSLALTIAAYSMVRGEVLTGWPLIYSLTGLALVQTLVQLLFFLHLRHEAEPRWKLLVFDFMLLIIAILVFGSLWIMNNLNYNGHNLPTQGTDQYIIKDEGIDQ
jgi:cytochrome o ubiquinol oxidase operon protein cyoD